jgi:formate dehydrogenase major subunit
VIALGAGAPNRRRYTRAAGHLAGDESARPFKSRHEEARKPLPKSYVRLTQPLVRDTKGGELRPATWDEALDRTVAGLSAALASRPGAERPPVGMFSCSKATNEVNYAAQKFSRVVLGSNNIDSCNRT